MNKGYMTFGAVYSHASQTIVPAADHAAEKRGGFWSANFTPSVNGELVNEHDNTSRLGSSRAQEVNKR
jgi:hypothetical protein